VPKVCRVRRPETKGKVERLVNYVKNNFIPGREFTAIADLNLQAMSWCEKANAKISGTTGETAYHMLSSEHLSSLPDPVHP